MPDVAAVILAAGASRRMGTPKQLLRWGDTTLLGRAVAAARDSACSTVHVVLGAFRERIAPSVGARVILNADWEEGLSSSFRAAARTVRADAALFLPVDLPFITGKIIDRFVDAPERIHCPIIASEFDGQVGTPALFASSVFPELLQLKGDAGARPVIAADPGRVYRLPVPEAAADVDTPQNFKDLLRRAFLLRIP